MPWRCDLCTFVNYRDSITRCEMCEKERPEEKVTNSTTSSSYARRIRKPRPKPPALDTRTISNSNSEQSADNLSPNNSAIDGAGTPTSGSSQTENEERVQLLQEIIQSERAYVDSLCVLVTHFLQPLETAQKEAKAPVAEKVIQGIFSNIQQIMSINVELLRAIETDAHAEIEEDPEVGITCEAMSNAITKAFTELIPYFKMYSWYVNNYAAAIELLKSEQSSNKAFAKFLAEKHSHPVCKGLDVGAFLIMPVQRLCKYPLLFDRLLKATPEDNHDYESIKHVSMVVNQITKLVDLDRDRAEKSLRGFEIANFISIENLPKSVCRNMPLLKAGRSFKYEWTGFVSRTSSKRGALEQKRRVMFLFSDVLIVAKRVSKGYDAKQWLELEDILLSDLAPTAQKHLETQSSNDSTGQRSSGRGWKPILSGLLTGNGSSTDSSAPKKTISPKSSKESSDESLFQFSLISNTTLQSGSRLSFSRSKSTSKVSETYTFHFSTEAARLKAFEQIQETIAANLVSTTGDRPRSSHGLRAVSQIQSTLSTSSDTSPRSSDRARSLSPQPNRPLSHPKAALKSPSHVNDTSTEAVSQSLKQTSSGRPAAPKKRPPAPTKSEETTLSVPSYSSQTQTPPRLSHHSRSASFGEEVPKSGRRARPVAPTKAASPWLSPLPNDSVSRRQHTPAPTTPKNIVTAFEEPRPYSPIPIAGGRPVQVVSRPAIMSNPPNPPPEDSQISFQDKTTVEKWFGKDKTSWAGA